MTPAEIGYETLDPNSETSVPPTPMRGIPACSSTSTTPAGLLNVRSLSVATTPSSTIWRAQATSPLASPLVSHTSAWSLALSAPTPPRLLNAATAASNASFTSGFDASGPVSAVIMPTFTAGVDPPPDCADAEVAPNGTATAARRTASTTRREARRSPRSFTPMVPPTVTTAARGPEVQLRTTYERSRSDVKDAEDRASDLISARPSSSRRHAVAPPSESPVVAARRGQFVQRSIAEMVADAIRAQIVAGTLPDGTMLPKQDQLISEFQV